ncbi:uncharacterized protein NFIA_113470 [Aspergillus fischeri NRRL 181]|uniref:Uncharacterized protein n=1 Tax=Neosartorya fischeri (strain ATCC 1020 / DSM 3700 / CBS 544.65 / FGSC A1164 / JCM 1740 / NRRL 181 / WB 181) TaxID=331117 RepID=A1D8V6_NEOFI|nr:uncharacterized protein NFIA_113470 [Aspergillus fischeri NRRL 181]EAW20817.1 hypothetical protein NFIA_113470 [Aspergillus fischeri NRRL 181]KAG2002836.1 hypothetical protein GB937_009485 [Aspergillus fischeri]
MKVNATLTLLLLGLAVASPSSQPNGEDSLQEEMEIAATQTTRNKMVVARMLDGSAGIMTLAAMTGIGTGASALLKTIAVTQTIGATRAVAGVIGTGGAIIMILTVTGIGVVVGAKDIRF